MAYTLEKGPTARTFDIEDLVTQAWRGEIRVPHFQRDFRWNWDDVRRLFDSIVKGYPIGSLLLWQRHAPAAKVVLGALTIDAPEVANAYWVVDGQQRLTSLANALHADGALDPRFALSYNLEREEFVRPATSDPMVIPLPVLFDLQQVLQWFSDKADFREGIDRASRITKILRQYEAPAYLVQSQDTHVLQDIFDRMNNFGKRLSRAEIFTALNAGTEEESSDTPTLEGIAGSLDADTSFGIIDNDTVLQAVLARRGPDVRRDIRREFEHDDDEGLNAAYEAGEEAMKLAIRFLQNDAGVPHFALLAYRYLLVVLTRLFAFHPNIDGRNRRLLRRWYWQAAVSGPERFRGGTPNAARILCGKVDPNSVTQSIQRLLDAVTPLNGALPDAKRFSTKDASSKVLLCMLWSLKPRDPSSGDEYGLVDLNAAIGDASTSQPAIRNVVQRSLIPEVMRPWAASRALMPGQERDQSELTDLLSAESLFMPTETWSAVLSSHLLNGLIGYLGDTKVDVFLKERQSLIERRLATYLGEMCEWEFENTPPLATFDLDDELGA